MVEQPENLLLEYMRRTLRNLIRGLGAAPSKKFSRQLSWFTTAISGCVVHPVALPRMPQDTTHHLLDRIRSPQAKAYAYIRRYRKA
jgi:hypothetical protein